MEMLLWLMFCAHRLGTSCCGLGSGHLVSEHVTVVGVLEDVAAVNVLDTSILICVRRLRTCCCGSCSGHIDSEHVSVVNLLCTSTQKMLLW